MKFGSRRMVLAIAGAVVVWLISIAFAGNGIATSARPSVAFPSQSIEQTGHGAFLPVCGDGPAFVQPGVQTGAGERQPMSEEIFENIQVLQGIPADEFMGTMSVFSSSLGMCCNDCHVGNQDWVTDSAGKRTARIMVRMTDALNRDHFGGRQIVTCWTCHRGGYPPPVTPELDLVYGELLGMNDDIREQHPWSPPPDEILDKYIEALGGAESLANLTGFVASGTAAGYQGGQAGPFDLFASAPNQRTLVVHWQDADRTLTYDGRAGWEASPVTAVPVITWTGGELDKVRLEAELSFPGLIKEVLADWRTNISSVDTAATFTAGNPEVLFESRPAYLLQGTTASGHFANLYFDQQSGLLTRVLFYANTRVGRNPTQFDYFDYREVAGVMMPFRWHVKWTGGWDIFEVTDLQVNVPIDPARFARPAPTEARPGSRIPAQ